ncbi:MAG: hypothetical protein KDK07_12555 [Bauldia sp.]|nr:hypothetical protein [Bauldia sp.]
MSPKILGDAPSIPIGYIFWTWAKYSGDVRTQASLDDLFQDPLNLPKHESPNTGEGASLFAAAPTESFDWSDEGSVEGRDGGHHGSSHDTQGDAGATTALSLFKAFGVADLDL